MNDLENGSGVDFIAGLAEGNRPSADDQPLPTGGTSTAFRTVLTANV